MKKAEAKYETGDKVWMIKDQKAVSWNVQTAIVEIEDTEAVISYYLKDENGSCDFHKYPEAFLHPSREELISNL